MEVPRKEPQESEHIVSFIRIQKVHLAAYTTGPLDAKFVNQSLLKKWDRDQPSAPVVE
jgi:hypothetical protein